MPQRRPEWMKMGAFLTTSRHATHSLMENISQIWEISYGKYLRAHCNTGVTHTKKSMTSLDILILSGITPREYTTSCPSDWSIKITSWPTTANMEMILLSTAHSGQHLRWPRMVCFNMILDTYRRTKTRTSWWTTCITPYPKWKTRRKDTPPVT